MGNITRFAGKLFKWVENTSQFNENFVKSCNEENDEGYFLEVDV